MPFRTPRGGSQTPSPLRNSRHATIDRGGLRIGIRPARASPRAPPSWCRSWIPWRSSRRIRRRGADVSDQGRSAGALPPSMSSSSSSSSSSSRAKSPPPPPPPTSHKRAFRNSLARTWTCLSLSPVGRWQVGVVRAIITDDVGRRATAATIPMMYRRPDIPLTGEGCE
jgi:hypothetical protein